jgi:putative component of membrane protein insertase Oxa1/YidC/SpoIIIJ protein YidD
MRALLLAAIRFYQRRISPHKGFCCAYRAHTARASCSSLGLRAVRRYGALAGLAVLNRRLYLCGVAHRRFSSVMRPQRQQRGDCDCDLPCDSSCDLPGPRSCPAGECLDFGSCDWGRGKSKDDTKDKDGERHVHIPGQG